MLYNYDPILPFEYADKIRYSFVSDDEAEYQGDMESDGLSEVSGTTDPLVSKIQILEHQHKHFFDKANKSIKNTKASSQRL